MARRNYYRKTVNVYRRARRYGGRARRLYRRSGIKFTSSPVYWLGAAIGAFTSIDNKRATLISALATAPVSGGRLIGMIKGAAKGCTFGNNVTQIFGKQSKLEMYGDNAINKIKKLYQN